MLNQPLEGLIERVSKATGPDRFLDAHIRVALEPPADDDSVTDCPFYTSSIDAALGLVERLLPGYRWGVSSAPIKDGVYHDGKTKYADGFKAHLTKSNPIRPMPTIGEARTATLAIVLATLRAIQSTKTGDAA